MSSAVQEIIAKLTQDSGNVELLTELDDACIESENWPAMAKELANHALEVADPLDKARFLLRAVWAGGHAGVAMEIQAEVLAHIAAIELDYDGISTALRRAFLIEGDWGALAETAVWVAQHAPAGMLRAQLEYFAGRTFEDRLYDADRAIKLYRSAWKVSGGQFIDPLPAARSILAHNEDWKSVAAVYGAQIQHTTDPRQRARLLVESGRVLITQLGRRDQGIIALRQALELDPDLESIRIELEQMEARAAIARGEEQLEFVDVEPIDDELEEASAEAEADEPAESDDVADDGEAEASDDAADDEAADEELEGAAEVAAEADEGEFDEAAEAEYVEIEGSEGEPEEYAEDSPDEHDEELAAEVDEPAYDQPDEDESDHEEPDPDEAVADEEFEGSDEVAAEADEGELEQSEASDELDEEAEDGEDAGDEAAEDEADSDEADEDEVAAESEEPDEDEVAAEADDSSEDEVAAEADEPTEDESAEDEVATEADDEEPEAADDDEDEAEDLEPIPEEIPEGSWLWAAWAKEGEDLDRIQRAIAALDGAEEPADVAARLELMSWIGAEPEEVEDIVLEALMSTDDSLELARQLLMTIGVHRPLVRRLALRIAEEASDEPSFAGAAYAFLLYGCGDEGLAKRFRGQLGPVEQAEEESISFLEKGNWRRAMKALEPALESEYGGQAEVEGYYRQALLSIGQEQPEKIFDAARRVGRKDKTETTLRRLSRNAALLMERWPQVIDGFKVEAESEDSLPELRAAWLGRMLGVYRDELKQDMLVMQTTGALLEVEPENIELMDSYAELLESMNRFPDLLALLRKKVDVMDSDEDKVEVLETLAGWLTDRTPNPQEAMKVYEEIRELQPNHMGAMEALDGLYESRREWDLLIALKRERVEAANTAEERIAIWREAATLAATRMRDIPLAITLHEEILGEDAQDFEALESLEQLFEREKNAEKVAEVLAQRAPLIEDEQARQMALIKLGVLQGDKLGYTEDAVATWEELLELDPDNMRAREALKKGYMELQRWDDLENLFASIGAWQDYARQLDMALNTIDDDDESTQLNLLFRSARVWTDELEMPDRAVKSYERILQIDSTNGEAAKAVLPYYEGRRDFKKLPDLLEVVLDGAEDDDERFACQRRLGELYAEHLRDPALSLYWFGEALRTKPATVEMAATIEEQAAGADAWGDVEELYRECLSALEGSEQEAWRTLSLRLAAIFEEQLSSLDDALEVLDSVLIYNADDREVLEAKDRIYVATEAWDDLLDVVETWIRLEESDDSKIAQLVRLAEIHEQGRDDAHAAIETQRRVLELRDDDAAALEALDRLYGEVDDPHSLRGILEQRIAAASEGEEQDQLRIRLVDLLAHQLEEPVAAVDNLAILVDSAPENEEVVSRLEELLDNPEVRHRVAVILDPLLAIHERWREHVDVLEVQLEALSGVDERVELLSRMAQTLVDELDEQSEALETWSRVLREAPDNEQALEALDQLADQLDSWQHVADLLEEVMESVAPDNSELAVSLGDRCANIVDQRLGDAEEAVRIHERILSLQPGRLESLLALDQLLDRLGQWQELLHNLERRLEISEDPATLRELRFWMASICEQQLEDAASAAIWMMAARDADPADAEALEALDRLYGELEDAPAQVEVINARLMLVADDAQAVAALKMRLAIIHEEELADHATAIGLWAEMLEANAEDYEALAALERQLENEDLVDQVANVLEPYHTDRQEWDALTNLLEIRLQTLGETEEGFKLLERIANLVQGEQAEPERAWDYWMRGARWTLSYKPYTEALYSLAPQLDRWSELADTLQELANDEGDPILAREHLIGVAGIRERELGDSESAAGIWSDLLEDDPFDADALNALERLLEPLQRWEQLVDVLLRKADLPDFASDPSARQPLLYRAAKLQEEELGHLDEAIEVNQTILRDDPAQAVAAASLERLFAATERWEEWVDNREQMLTVSTDDAERRELLFGLSETLEVHLEDPDRAVGVLKRVLAIDETDGAALREIARLYELTENWYELLDVFRKQVDLEEDEAAAAALRYKIAGLLDREMMDVSAALAEYKAILEIDSSHDLSREALWEFVHRGDEATTAAATLEPLFVEEGAWEALRAMWLKLVELAEMPNERQSLYRKISKAAEIHLGDTAGAWEATANALRQEFSAEDIDELERLAGPIDRWADTATLFEELTEEVLDPAMRAELGLRIANIQETRLGEISAAIETLSRVHDEDPQLEAPLDGLERLYRQEEVWESLADTLEKLSFLRSDPAAARACRLERAEVLFARLGEPLDALQIYRELLSADPDDEAALAALERFVADGVEVEEVALILEPLHRSAGRWAELVTLNQARISVEEDPDERHRLWLEIADVFEQSIESPADALQALGSALVEQPSDQQLRDRLEAVAEPLGAHNEVWAIYHEVLQNEELDEADRFDTSYRLAVLLETKVGDAAGAESVYRVALDLEPDDDRVLSALDRLLTNSQSWEELEIVLRRRRDVVYDPEVLGQLTERHAQLLESELGAIDSAVEVWQERLDQDASSELAMGSLHRLHRIREDWESLYDICDRRSMAAESDEERVEHWVEMAEIAATKLDQPDEAIDLWNRVLMVRQDDERALDELVPLLTETERFNELCDVLRKQADKATDDETKKGILLQLAWRQAEELQLDEAAAQTYNEVLALEPANENALLALRALYERSGDSQRLAATIITLLETGLIDDSARMETLEELGRLQQDVLASPEQAIETWNQVRQLSFGHEEALERLDMMLTQTEAWEPLTEVLYARAQAFEAEDDAADTVSEERIDYVRRAAHVFDQNLSDPARAVEAWERLVDLDLTDLEAIGRLEELYEQLSLWEAYASLLVDRIEVIEDEFERLEVLGRAAKIYEERLEQPQGAWLLTKRALSEAPLEENLLKEAERLAAVADEWQDFTAFIAGLAQHVAAASGEEETLPLVLAMGRAQRDHLSRLDMAEIYFDKALGLDPESEEALEALDGIYTNLESWDDLARILRRRAELAFDPELRLGLLRRAAQTSDQKVGDVAAAIDDWMAVWDSDEADEEAPAALDRLYVASERWEQLVELLDRKAASSMDLTEQRALRMRIAEVLRDQIGDTTRAIEAFEDVTSMAMDDLEALRALEELFLRVEDWDSYADNLESQLHATADNERKIELYRALALVAESKFEDVDRALAAHTEILNIEPKDLSSISEMERILEEQGRVYELVDIYEKHVAVLDDSAGQIEVLSLMARAIADFIEDIPRAIGVCERILAIDDGHRETLASLANLHQRTENIAGAVEAYDKLAAVADDSPEVRADALHRAAVLLLHQLGDAQGAESRLRSSLTTLDGHLPSLDALIEVQLATSAWEPAISTIQNRIELTHDLSDRAKYLVQIGEINELQLGQLDVAQRLYEEAIDLDPNNVFAAAPLAEMYIATERWERVKPMLELLLREDGGQMDAGQLRALYLNLGRACTELELDHDALAYYEKVLELVPDDIEALTAVAEQQYRRQDYEAAYRAYLELLHAHSAQMSQDQMVGALYRAGSIAAQRGDQQEAVSLLSQAVGHDASHEPSLRELLPLQKAAGDLAGQVDTQRKLVAVSSDTLEQFTLLVEIGDLLADNDSAGAIDAYKAAVDIDNSSIVVLSKLLQAFMEQENWKRATEVLGQMANVEQDPQRSSRYFFALANLLNEELAQPDQALRFMDAALDRDVQNLEVFSAIDRMLTERRDWEALEVAYRKMVKRVVNSHARADMRHVEFTLYKNLGEIYRTRLNKVNEAITAFKLASELQPEEALIHQILAELYARSGTHLPELIDAHRRMIAISPAKTDSYEVLFRAYMNQGNRDAAWCVASALQAVNPDFEEGRLQFRKYVTHATPQLTKTLNDAHWRMLQPEGYDEIISEIFAILAVNLRSTYTTSLKEWGLRRRDIVDLSEPMPLTKEMQTAFAGFRIQPSPLYARQDLNGLSTMNTDPWAIVAGGDVVRGRQERELRFLVGRVVSMLRPQYFLASIVGSDLLMDLLLGAIGAFTQQIPAQDPARTERIRNFAMAIVALPAPVKAQLQQRIDMLRRSGRNPNVSTWMSHVDEITNRAGLLLCGDVKTTCALVRAESRIIGKNTPQDRVSKVLVFSVSENYFTLREELGLSLNNR